MRSHEFVRKLLRSAFAALVLGASIAAMAQPEPWPSRTITIVVPFVPGGAVGVAGRAVATALSEALKVPVIVDHKPGAGAMVGAEYVARSAPDGYTLLVAGLSSLAVSPILYKSTAKYDPIRSFAPVVLFAQTPGILAVNPNRVKATDVAQLVAAARSSPGMTYASPGNGNFQHLVGEMFKSATSIDLVHVPYKGSGPALVDTIGGQVDMIFDVIPSAAPHIRAGKLRGIAVTTAQRSEQLPDVPTMKEAGLQGFDLSSWYALVAPAGTPEKVIERLNVEVNRALKGTTLRSQLLAVGASPVGGTSAELGLFMRNEATRWVEVIRANGIKAE